jgi:hypothetical protein
LKHTPNHYTVEPEVAGGWGENTVADVTVHPPRVSRLHYRFDGWLGDVVVESSPCYIVTEEARRNIEDIRATGVRFDQAEITTSEEFEETHPGLRLPKFVWMKIDGLAGKDDFGIAPAPDFRLVVSQRILDMLNRLGLAHALIEPFKG